MHRSTKPLVIGDLDYVVVATAAVVAAWTTPLPSAELRKLPGRNASCDLSLSLPVRLSVKLSIFVYVCVFLPVSLSVWFLLLFASTVTTGWQLNIHDR